MLSFAFATELTRTARRERLLGFAGRWTCEHRLIIVHRDLSREGVSGVDLGFARRRTLFVVPCFRRQATSRIVPRVWPTEVGYADHGSNTILPPSPPRSMRAWISLAAASGSRSITMG